MARRRLVARAALELLDLGHGPLADLSIFFGGVAAGDPQPTQNTLHVRTSSAAAESRCAQKATNQERHPATVSSCWIRPASQKRLLISSHCLCEKHLYSIIAIKYTCPSPPSSFRRGLNIVTSLFCDRTSVLRGTDELEPLPTRDDIPSNHSRGAAGTLPE